RTVIDGEKKILWRCEDYDIVYVKLISSDSHKFIVKREYALTSGTIRAMLSDPVQLWKMKPLKFAALTAPLRMPDSQMHLKLHWNF
ncbi:hypothetical protein HPG69_009666, partial [Diceros bicornis minor]